MTLNGEKPNSCNDFEGNGPGNVVGITTNYELDGPGIESPRGGGGEIFRTCPDRP